MTKWQLVPVVPTPEMCAVIRNENCVYTSDDELYAALLEATPQPELLSDSRIKELFDSIDFSMMCTADDLFYMIARAVEREILGEGDD